MMFFRRILPKIAAHWIINLYRAARKLRNDACFQYNRNSSTRLSAAAASRCTSILPSAVDRMVVFDFHGGLLRSTALFPYFMLVACEGGSLLRALLLLCCFPLVWVLGEHVGAAIRVMAFVTFVGLRPRDAELVARAILPKFYMERLNAQVYDHLWLPTGKKVAVTSAPRVMAEWFLKEYMAADVVVGCELQMVKVGRRCYFTGLLCDPSAGPGALAFREMFRADDAMADVAVVGSSNPLDHFFVPYCKGRPVRVRAQDAGRPDHAHRGAAEARAGRDLQPQPPLGDHRAHQDGAAHARPRTRRRDDVAAAGARRPRGLPRRHNMPRALPAAVQPALRRAGRRHGARGAGRAGDLAVRHHGKRPQVARPRGVLRQPCASLPGRVPGRCAAGSDARRGEDQRRGSQLGPAAARPGAWVRMYRP